MVDCSGLTDDCEIPSRTDRQGVACHFVSKELCVLLLQAEAVILVLFLPVFKLDDKVDLLLLLDTLHTVESLDIDDADSAHLDEVSCDIR